jgi:hypothetical protein
VELAPPDATTAEARLAIVQAVSLELVNRYGVAVSARRAPARTPRQTV